MHKEEKRRKFHEAILNKLYPPPPPAPKTDLDKEKEELADLNLIKDGLEDDSSSLEEKFTSSGESECEQQQKKKLTRAQRKRLRKKKLKEAASCRRNIIGPLLPEADGGDDDDLEDDNNKDSTSEVHDLNSLLDKPGELSTSSTTQKKLKHRRMAKKLKQNNVGSNCHDEADSSLLCMLCPETLSESLTPKVRLAFYDKEA